LTLISRNIFTRAVPHKNIFTNIWFYKFGMEFGPYFKFFSRFSQGCLELRTNLCFLLNIKLNLMDDFVINCLEILFRIWNLFFERMSDKISVIKFLCVYNTACNYRILAYFQIPHRRNILCHINYVANYQVQCQKRN
jgi:hypothetical protein